ncbi:MAG: DUF4907 domain-containing protein [Bacteroidales bacterium]|nr:DUF4907 domain-containing protein [Bacteroidales bacterium]
MKQTFIVAALMISFFAGCISNTPPKDLSQWDTTAQDGLNLRLETIQVDSGWGYAIFADGKKLIMQRQIPVIEGNHTFETQQDAYNCAHLVIVKLLKGEMPPSVTRNELIELNIIKK